MDQPEAMNKTQLAQAYKVSTRQLVSWLLPIKDKIELRKGKQTFKPAYVKIIFSFLDEPESEYSAT